MGTFSWKTADTNESIAISDSSRGARDVYLLQPGDEAPIKEDDYEGCGVFGGVDAYQWLAERNLTPEQLQEAIEVCGNAKMVGVSLEHGNYFEHSKTGQLYTIFHRYPPIVDQPITHLDITYGTPHEFFDGMDANTAIKSGLLIPRRVELEFPLKFSFSPNEDYASLPASERCPYQGVYFPEDEDEDDEEA
ncbi:hypothetical protein [Erythrobacter aureus]|uniref:Uncharacterized protein n=1 Tax=Erythrobacter aureus TaxID=2182384 RepID=A0A345YIQ7_9SPHN|nr:hypothetical protein [Erythrobacter aureus]AXK43809.1 hypothetical protein DVR09_15245 [Erythrobacter aureus]